MVITQPESSSATEDFGADGDRTAEQEKLVPYLPRMVIEWMATSPELRHRTVDATVDFVDISGFTKLSERLSKHGKIGAEELASTISDCFVGLLEVAYDNGGRLLKFGGDALLLMFTGTDHERRACRAAYEMRRALRVTGRLTVLGHQVALRMSVGVHSGSFDLFLVGSSHRELVITGPAASATVAMEAAATPGEILVSKSTAAALAPSDLGEAKADGRLLRRAPVVRVEAVTPLDGADTRADLSACIPAAILSSIRSHGHEPEHRRVTVGFVHFDGTDTMLEAEGPGPLTSYLDVLISDIQHAVERQGVTFIGTDIDHDGGKVILAAGTPSSSGDDEHHMLLALRQIMDGERHPPLRVGVNRGPVFSGDIGPPFRRTFTVMGDTVNLAARLMAKATPGRILATPGVLARSRSEFEVDEVAPFFVKGKAKAIEAFEVGARKGARVVETGSRLPLVGRHQEMEIWEQRVHSALAGSGSVVEVVGEPGVGKSRLVEEFKAASGGLRALSANCEYYDSTTPYGVLRGLLRQLLGLEESGEDLGAGKLLGEALSELSPSLLPWAPLIGSVADVDMEDTAETAEIEPEFRAPRLGAVMTDLLGLLLPAPTVFFFEDTHWMDEASAELLRHVIANAQDRPWLLCFTRRDVEGGFVAPAPSSVRLALQPLGGEDAAELVDLATQGSPLRAHDVSLLAERSGGNPLFLRELLAAAREHEDIESLPDSVEALIAARIDRLSSDDRYFLRRVSVLGRSAPWELLRAVVDTVPQYDDPLWFRLFEFVAPDAIGNVVFRHALLRDGAYSGLSYRSRRDLHGRVADAILRAAGERSEEQAELLSLHYLHAQRFGDAWTYSLVAAERARGLSANLEAAEFYERALLASRRLEDLSATEIAEVHERLGDTRNRTSNWVEADAQYRLARRLVSDEPLVQARLMFKVARVQGWRDRFSNGLRWITRALHMLEGIDGIEAARQRAQLFTWYGRFSQEQGNHARAITWLTKAVTQAELADEKEALANALLVLDWALMDMGGNDEPANLLRALAIMEDIGDLQGQGTVLNSLGVRAHFRGDWDQALVFYSKAQEKARRVGDSVRLGVYENNVAEIALDQGRVADARRVFESVSRAWRAAGFKPGLAYVKCNLARCTAKSGDFAQAIRLFREARSEAEAADSQDMLEAGARWAECELLAGDVEGARQRATVELEKALAIGGCPQLPLLFRVLGVALARSGDLDAARGPLEKSLQAAAARQAGYERALTLEVLAALSMEHDGNPPEDLAAEARHILDGLGVAATPDLLAAGTRLSRGQAAT